MPNLSLEEFRKVWGGREFTYRGGKVYTIPKAASPGELYLIDDGYVQLGADVNDHKMSAGVDECMLIDGICVILSRPTN